MNPNRYEKAQVILQAQDEEILHETVQVVINTLSYNAAWGFQVENDNKGQIKSSVITFKYNGCITALNGLSKLRMPKEIKCRCKWKVENIIDITKLSDRVITALQESGWNHLYKYNTDDWISILASEGYVINEYAKALLNVFGNLKVHYSIDYQENKKYWVAFSFDPIFSASGEFDRLGDCMSITKENIFPIGEMHDYTIYAGDSKRIYLADWKSISCVGNDIEEFFNNMFDPFYVSDEIEFES